jgi:hypothetical protein
MGGNHEKVSSFIDDHYFGLHIELDGSAIAADTPLSRKISANRSLIPKSSLSVDSR